MTGRLAGLLLLAQQASAANTTASWLAKRGALIEAALGTPTLPSRSVPDGMKLLGPAFNTTPGVVQLTWDLSDPRFFEISSGVFYSPAKPGALWDETQRSKEAFLFHHGHSSCHCPGDPGYNPKPFPGYNPGDPHSTCAPDCQSSMRPGWPGNTWWDMYNVSGFFHSMGHDVFILSMPIEGINFDHPPIKPWSHWWFKQWEDKGDHPLRYFLEPIFLTVNFALEQLGYADVHMAGLSGGGWSTTFGAAMDPRIKHSFPIAGSLPCAMRNPEAGKDAEDFEQSCNPNPNPKVPEHPGRPAFQACNYTCMYVLAGLEPERFQLQILHEHDDCCFAAEGRHGTILDYEANVRAELSARGQHGWFTTVSDNHTHHEVSPRDKALLQAAHTAPATPGSVSWDKLPCDILHPTGGQCNAPDFPPDAPWPGSEELRWQ